MLFRMGYNGRKLLGKVRPAGIEPATFGFEDLPSVKISVFSNPLILVRFSVI